MIFTYIHMCQTDHWQHVTDSIDNDSTRTVESYANAYVPAVILKHPDDGYEYHVILKRTLLYRDVYLP